jgi:hypothetical protein
MLTLADGSGYRCANNVRNLENKKRRREEVARTIPDGLPYSPQPFPRGLWSVTGIEYRKDFKFDAKTYGDVKIRTNAYQNVSVWELDGDGAYYRKTDKQAADSGYLLHESRYNTTLGCIRLPDGKGLEIAGKMAAGDILEVV